MAENLERVMGERYGRMATQMENKLEIGGMDRLEPTLDVSQTPSAKREPLHLPDEIILQILEYTSHASLAQKTLASCCLLSHQWYNTSVPLLYRHPHLYGNNYDHFVSTICPSINLHVRKSPLSALVKILDMSQLVHQGSKSTTARLLGRTKNNVEEFIAPQASFAMNCFPALSKCTSLRLLDLSLVSESPPLPDLFRTISHLSSLQTFRLPRSSGFGVHHTKPSLAFTWPMQLQNLTISGGIDAHFLHGVVKFPASLASLTIEHCPLAKAHAVTHLLKTAVRPLERLEEVKIRQMPCLSSHALDGVLFLLPQISRLSVSVDYITPAIFDEAHFRHPTPPLPDPEVTNEDEPPVAPIPGHSNLRLLELTSSGSRSKTRTSGFELDIIDPIDIAIAIDEGTLPQLRQVRVAKSLMWSSSDDVGSLVDVLQRGSRRDWEARGWVFEGMGEREYRREGCWEDAAGVWEFEG